MARKINKKSPAKSAKPTPKKVASKAKPKGPKNPATITTGKGASAREIGDSLVELYNAGKWDEPCKKWWSPKIVSVEGAGMAWSGRAAVLAKNADWYTQHKVLGGSAEGPFVGASGFAVKFRMEFEVKASGQRIQMDEVGVYTVSNGKIVREEFMYGAMTMQQGAA